MNLADFDTREIEFARHLWLNREFPSMALSAVLPWERVKPEVQIEFCIYARLIRTREFRGKLMVGATQTSIANGGASV